jgi:hypothetical protein
MYVELDVTCLQKVLVTHTHTHKHTLYVTLWIRHSCFELTDVNPVSSDARPPALLMHVFLVIPGNVLDYSFLKKNT